MSEPFCPPKRSWLQKFGHAFHGVWLGIRGQRSFAVHIIAGLLVVLAAALLRVTRIEWCLLLLCITVVFSAEMFNSALEQMAKAVERSENPLIAQSLDIGSAAVLMASIGASVIGAVIFLARMAELVNPK